LKKQIIPYPYVWGLHQQIGMDKNLIKKYPIIAISGCDGDCTLKILEQKGVKPIQNINVMDELNKKNLKPTDVSRLDDNGEICVEYMKNKIKNEIKRVENK
jgi:uncharacterized metal-binding protein